MFSLRIKRNGSQLSLVIIAAVLLAFAAYRLTSLWLVAEVSLGVSRSSEEFGKLFSALSRAADPDILKIGVKTFADNKDVASAVEQKAVDFAVIRPDVDLPTNGMTIAILQENPIILVSWEASKIKRADQFAGRQIRGGVDGRRDHSYVEEGAWCPSGQRRKYSPAGRAQRFGQGSHRRKRN